MLLEKVKQLGVDLEDLEGYISGYEFAGPRVYADLKIIRDKLELSVFNGEKGYLETSKKLQDAYSFEQSMGGPEIHLEQLQSGIQEIESANEKLMATMQEAYDLLYATIQVWQRNKENYCPREKGGGFWAWLRGLFGS